MKDYQLMIIFGAIYIAPHIDKKYSIFIGVTCGLAGCFLSVLRK